jgi:alkylated DNA repair protein alkB family protein 4
MEKNFKIRDEKCGCTGTRSCLICESYRNDKFIAGKVCDQPEDKRKSFDFCAECGTRAWFNLPHHSDHISANEEECILISGIHLFEEVITPDEEAELVRQIDASEWVNSQSGRRKQDYGPRVNFKKQKLSLEKFHGLPHYIRSIWERLQQRFADQLSDFIPIELCNLEYDSSRGSSIEPHFDDFWVWGERLVTLNYLSDTVLTLTYPQGTDCEKREMDEVEVRIRMRRRALLVLAADARTKWMHCIKRKDIRGRRIATTWREFSPEFLPGGTAFDPVGRDVLSIASKYI